MAGSACTIRFLLVIFVICNNLPVNSFRLNAGKTSSCSTLRSMGTGSTVDRQYVSGNEDNGSSNFDGDQNLIKAKIPRKYSRFGRPIR